MTSLMSVSFPSIWLEFKDQKGEKMLICGFYREWTREGKSSESDQEKRIEILLNQFDMATESCKRVIVLGDANVCAIKWADPSRKKNKLAQNIKNKLEECGMINLDVGITFTSDIVQKNGKIATSALDHI